MYFKNNIIKFKKVDIINDIIEISFILISDKIKRCKPLLLDLKSFEINKSIKKLFEMPDKSFIDISYIIKEEINEENDLIKDYNNSEDILEFKKFYSNQIDLNKDNAINLKKYYTPMITKKVPNTSPMKLDLNSNLGIREDDSNLAQKIFKKIFDKNRIDNLNHSFEIITYNTKTDLKNIDYNKIKNEENNFCSGIFISGLKSPIDISSFFETSKSFVSSCGHKNCSNLLSLKPEIISKYLSKSNQLLNELNYLVANLCFPLGIKICFQNIKNKINKNFRKIHYNIIKNSKDAIYYITTVQYFIKMKYKTFKEKYNYDLISHYNNKDKNEIYLKKITDVDILYIPESISLISKYPFFIPMNICLNVILSLNTIHEKNCLINHLINEVPIPKKLTQILFYIPKIKNPIILNHKHNLLKSISSIPKEEINFNPKIYQNVSMSQFNLKILLRKISIENLIFLFQLLLLEQQILIVENDYEILSEIIFILMSLIYPLGWINPFLPILSFNTVQFLQTPVPYIMGIDEYLLKFALNSKNIHIGKEIIIYNISSKTFTLGKVKKKMNKKAIINLLKLNMIPDSVDTFLITELKKKEKILNEINIMELDLEIRLIFMKAMILLIGDFNNYTFYTNDNDMTLFNKEAFIEAHKEKKMQLFLEQMVKTQIFKQFLLNEKQLYLKNIYKKRNSKENFEIFFDNKKIDENNIFDTSYFKKLVEKYPELINNRNVRKSSFDLDYTLNESNFDFKVNRSKKSSGLRLKFDSKKEINKNIKIEDLLNPKPNKNDLMIDLDNLSNPLKLENMTKSHNLDIIKNNNCILDFNKNNEGFNKGISNEYNYNNIIIKKKNKLKKFLLFPYFIEDKKDISSKYNNIYEYILEYNKNNNYELFDFEEIKDIIFIFDFDKLKLDFSGIDSLNIHQYINKPNKNNDNFENDIRNNNLNDKKITNEEKNEILKESKINVIDDKNNETNFQSNIFNISKEQSEIKTQELKKEYFDLIKDCFTLCLTNKSRITESQFSTLENLFSDKNFRNYFSNLIFIDIKLKTQHKQMMELAFNDFVSMIKLCLLQIKEDEYQIGRKITISCFSYYKIYEEKKYCVYQSINSNEYKIWKIDLFWIEFFKIEIKEAKKFEEMKLKNLDNDKSLIEFKSKFSILMDISLYISKIMIKLNLNRDFIIKIFEKMILPVYEFDYENINKIIKAITAMF